MNRLTLFALAGAFALTACDSTEPERVEDLDVQTAVSIEADPTINDPATGQPTGNNDLFTLYDLDAGEVVLSSSETDRDVRQRDSVSTVWDIGFKGTTIIVNGGTSGPGQGTAQVLKQTFASVTEAPAAGYVADGANECPTVETPRGTFPGQPFAICTGSDNGWYNYNGAQNLITPLPGRTIVLTTGDGDRYAKVRVLNYYKDNPAASEIDTSKGRYYTFEYVLQPDGSRGFATTRPDA